jgi:Ca2+-binding EF-hand superfamily protein
LWAFVDGDGYLSWEEFKHVIICERLFNVDGDKLLAWKEFKKVICERLFNVDRDGYLSREEFKHVIICESFWMWMETNFWVIRNLNR